MNKFFKSKTYTYIKNIVFISIFFSGLGALLNYNQIKEYDLLWHKWTIAGAFAGLALSLFGSFLDFFVMQKRKRMLKSAFFIKLQKKFSLNKYTHLLAGYYQNHPISISWSFLPVGKTPKSGISVFTVFKPTGSEKLFEIKKRIKKTSKVMAESFYIYQFITFDKKNLDLNEIETLINNNIKTISKYSSAPAPDLCINCNTKIPSGHYKIINDIPVPICPACENKVGK